jgi:predicted extracellular nuclease
MSAAAGKVALVTGTTALACGATGTTPAPCSSTQLAQIIDLVGYGTTATMFEGSSYAPAPSTTNAVFRGTLGCSETDNNNTDFTAALAAPRNSAATKNPCGPVLPILSINDVSLAEGNAGTTTFTFTVSLSSPAPAGGVTFDITTADGTATIADNDYVGRTLTGQSIAEASNSFSFDVTVNGDTNAELNETFFVNVTNVSSGVTVGDGQGQGTITNDDAILPVLSINDVTITEGNSGTGTASFTVSLSSPALAGGVTFDIATADGTATVADNDYAGRTLTGQSIAEAGNSFSFDVTVNGDTKPEGNETFFVNITNVSGAAVSDAQGLGTIVNDDLTPIYTIQGSGAATTLTGSVITEGIVVGDYEGGVSPQIRGFFIQDAVGDGNPATSDGLFVYNGSNNNVALGDLVRVTGTVSEYQGQTQISATAITIINSANTLAPTDISLPFASVADQERYEGMLVRVSQPLYVTEHYQLGRFGQVTLSGSGKLYQPTNIVLPGAAALAMQASNDLNKIILDDATNTENPDPIVFGRGGNPLSASNTLRGGDTITGLVGVFTYSWGGNSSSPNAYRIRPINTLGGGIPNFAADNARPSTPTSIGGTVKVAGFNLLNYFNTYADGNSGTPGCYPSGTDADCRGAESAIEFTRQSDKTVNAILAMNVDVIGIAEMENDGYGADSAIQDLVNKLNAATAPGTYAFINPDTTNGAYSLGTDGIKVGLLYKTTTVTPVGTTAVLNSAAFVNGGDTVARNRVSLLQAFETPTGERFIANINHFKSKGSCPAAGTNPGNEDAGDGQSCWNLVRINAANALTTWFGTDPTGTGDPDIVILGDLNSYAMEDPIAALESEHYTNLVKHFGGTSTYSYVFDGQWGYLDYALGSPRLLAQTTGVTEFHINSDEPSILDYNTNYKTAGQIISLYSSDPFRTGDHDPIIVGLNLNSLTPGAPTDITLSNSSIAENQLSGTLVGNLSSTDQNPSDTFTYSFCGGTDDGSFQISGSQLQTNAVFNYEVKNSYSICIRSTDSGSLFFDKTLPITITDANDAPTNIGLSNSSVAENQLIGTLIGNLSTADPDAGDTFTYSFCGGTDDGSFQISGSQLQSNVLFDYE